MKTGIIALSILLSSASVCGAEEKIVSVPFPALPALPRTGFLFCDAILSTSLEAVSEDSPYKITGRKPGVYAKAGSGKDRVVLEASGKKLYMHGRAEFENGESKHRIPLVIVENSDLRLVAFDHGPFLKGYSVVVVTVDRKTGIGTWTSTRTSAPLLGHPDVQTSYLTCGARKN